MRAFSFYPYERSCSKRGQRYFSAPHHRGIFLRATSSDGGFGVGEFAPHEGVHGLLMDHVMALLDDLDHEKAAGIFSLSPDRSLGQLTHFFLAFPHPVSFMLSMAHWHYWYKRAKSWRTLADDHVLLSAMIEHQSVDEAIALAEQYLANGYSCIKVKVSSLPIEKEAIKIAAISDLASDGVSVRIDANGSLSFDDARFFLQELKGMRIEYIEDPLREPEQIPHLLSLADINVALDAHLPSPNGLVATRKQGIRYLVIKPSRFHCIYALMDYVGRAQGHGLIPIFSHAFESEFSSSIYALLLGELGLLAHPAGIIAQDFFSQGLGGRPAQTLSGQISLADARSQALSDGTFMDLVQI